MQSAQRVAAERRLSLPLERPMALRLRVDSLILKWRLLVGEGLKSGADLIDFLVCALLLPCHPQVSTS